MVEYQRIRDEVSKERTGKTTKEGNNMLNKFNVKKNWHTLGAKLLLNKYNLSPCGSSYCYKV